MAFFVCLAILLVALLDGSGLVISSLPCPSSTAVLAFAASVPREVPVDKTQEPKANAGLLHPATFLENPAIFSAARDSQEFDYRGVRAPSGVLPSAATSALLARRRRGELFDQYKALLDQELERVRAAKAKERRRHRRRRHESDEEVVTEPEEEHKDRGRYDGGSRYYYLSRSIPSFSSERRTRSSSTSTTARLRRKGAPLWLKILGGVAGAVFVAGLGYFGYRLYKEEQEDTLPYDPWYPGPSPPEVYLLRHHRQHERQDRKPLEVEPGLLAMLFQEAAEGSSGPAVYVLPPGSFASIQVPPAPLTPEQQTAVRKRALRKRDLEAPSDTAPSSPGGRSPRSVWDISPRFVVGEAQAVLRHPSRAAARPKKAQSGAAGLPSRIPGPPIVQPGAAAVPSPAPGAGAVASPAAGAGAVAGPAAGAGAVAGPAAGAGAVASPAAGAGAVAGPAAGARAVAGPAAGAGAVAGPAPSPPTVQPGASGVPGPAPGPTTQPGAPDITSLSSKLSPLQPESTVPAVPGAVSTTQPSSRRSSRRSSAPGSRAGSPMQSRRRPSSLPPGGS